MATVQTVEHNSFESVWAGLQEVRQILKENAETHKKETERLMKETDRRMQETDRLMKENAEAQKETDRRMQETDRRMQETDRITKDNAKIIGKLGNRFGEMVEHMVMPNLVKKFREMGFVFTKAYPHATIEDMENNLIAEIDITLENGDKVMIVEVKAKLTTDDISDHIERMKKVQVHANLHNDKRQFLGAVAGMIMSQSEKTFALKNGFYVIEPSGETFTITAP